MLRFLLPNGSLSERLMMYLAIAGYSVAKPGRNGYCGTVNNVEFYQVDRRMIPHFLSWGVFHAGITGFDLLLDSGVTCLRSIAELCFSKVTDRPTRWVLVQRSGFVKKGPVFLCIGCELTTLASNLLEKIDFPGSYMLRRIEGSEEMCVANGLVDMALIVTETGESIKACGLEIAKVIPYVNEDDSVSTFLLPQETLLVSTPRILARQNLDPEKEEALTSLSLALQAVIGAQAFVMVSFDLPDTVDVAALHLPASVAPTVSPLLPPSSWKACEICIPRTEFGPLLPRLKAAGARGIVLREVQGYLP